MGVKEFISGIRCTNTNSEAGCTEMEYCIEANKLTHELKDTDINDSLFTTSVNSLLRKENCDHPSNTEARQKARNILTQSRG